MQLERRERKKKEGARTHVIAARVSPSIDAAAVSYIGMLLYGGTRLIIM